MSEKGEISLTRKEIALLWEKSEKELTPEDFDPELVRAKRLVEEELAEPKTPGERGLAPIHKSLQEEMKGAGLGGDSIQDLAGTEREITGILDRGWIEENIRQDTPHYKRQGKGEPICIIARKEDENSVQIKTPKYNDD